MSPPHRILVVPAARTRAGATRALLETYARHASDAAAVPAHLIAMRDELPALRSRLGGIPGVDLDVHAVEDLLAAVGCREEPAAVLAEFGRTTYDALRLVCALAVLPPAEGAGVPAAPRRRCWRMARTADVTPRRETPLIGRASNVDRCRAPRARPPGPFLA